MEEMSSIGAPIVAFTAREIVTPRRKARLAIHPIAVTDART